MVGTAEIGGLRVLLVDDNRAVRFVTGKLLSRTPGLELVATAESGEAALAFALTDDVDVVVMDVVMPGIGGVEATRRLKAALPTCRVVGHSANDAGSDMRAAGADAFVRKGEPTARLLEAIREGS